MEYLSFNAATIAVECIRAAIKRVEHGIESCGALTHKDSKQSDAAKKYFSKQLEQQKTDIESLRRLASELSKQVYSAGLKEIEKAGKL